MAKKKVIKNVVKEKEIKDTRTVSKPQTTQHIPYKKIKNIYNS
tara:strand:- start:5701 stop:5829 length:129 start_codon:yes stop_codon:yes gene_type:complete